MALNDVLSVVRQGSRFLLACHRRPDADAFGSALGLAAILRAIGKEAVVWVPEPLPRNIQFLNASDVAVTTVSGEFDATFLMDIASVNLLPAGLPREGSGPLIVFDHHAVHDNVGDIVFRDIHACATAVLVLRIARELGLQAIPGAAAEPLYAALVADTGGFRYSGTTPEVLRMGAELLEAGADARVVATELFERWPFARMQLLSSVLHSLRLEFDDRLAWLYVTRSTMSEVGATDEMVEGLVNYGRMLDGVEISCLLWECVSSSGQLETRINLRSAGRVDVAQLASTVGGGGHRAAAGAQVPAALAEVEAKIRTAAKAALDSLS